MNIFLEFKNILVSLSWKQIIVSLNYHLFDSSLKLLSGWITS